jgi:hypothetical protein
MAADPADRVRRVLQTKGRRAPSYWHDHGRRRFAAELASDGVPEPVVRAILGRIDVEMSSALLDGMLADLHGRIAGS